MPALTEIGYNNEVSVSSIRYSSPRSVNVCYHRFITKSTLLSCKGLIDQILSNKKALIPKDIGKNRPLSLSYIRARWASLPSGPSPPKSNHLSICHSTRRGPVIIPWFGSATPIFHAKLRPFTDSLAVPVETATVDVVPHCSIRKLFHLCKSCLGTAAG